MNSRTTTRVLAMAAALALVLVSCGDSGDTTTTVEVVNGVTAVTTTTAPAGTTVAPTTAAPTTTVPPTTTLPPTTTTVAATTTTAGGSTGDPAEATAKIDRKVAAVLAAAPEGWDTDMEEATVNSDDDVVFGPCTGPDAFDLDNLDPLSFGATSAVVADPMNVGPFPGPEADFEVRVFMSTDIATDAFAVLQEVFGTQEGRECMTQQFVGFLDAPDGTEFQTTVDAYDLAGASVGTRITIGFDVSGIEGSINVDLVAALQGDMTIYAVMQGFGEGFPMDVAEDLIAAALNG